MQELTEIKVLNEKEIKMIDEASRKILVETGILVHSSKILKLLSSKGANVNFETKIVKVSNKTIDECLNTVPKTIKLYYRGSNKYIELGGCKKTYVASGHNAIYYYDETKGIRRPITKEEVGNFARISDYLDEIDIVGIQAMPQDVKSKSAILHALDTVLNNTKKPVYFSPENGDEVKGLLDIIKIACGNEKISEKPVGICQLSPISPLSWSAGTCEGLAMLAQEKFPLMVLSQPIAGVTAPQTLAGLITMTNTEALSGIVFSQLVSPGAPVIYGSAWTTFEMSKGTALIGIPERYVCNIAHTQLARYYNLPCHSTAFDTDAPCQDEQCAIEKLFNAIATMLAKTDIIIDCGMFLTGLNVSYEQLIVDNDMAKFIRRFLKGVEINDDTIALDVINKVGHGKSFLMENHTLENIDPHERSYYQSFNRNVPAIWDSQGRPTIMDNAKKIAEKILNLHKVEPLDTIARNKIAKIIADFEKTE